MSDFAKDNNAFDAALELYDAERMANESLRQQLAEKDAEIVRLKSENHKLALDYVSISGQAFDAWSDLTASQAREQQLREAIAAQVSRDAAGRHNIATAALALPSDTSAIEAMIAKAGEMMRERCADVIGPYGNTRHLTSYEEGCEDTKAGIDTEIRAIPGVTLEDLKT